MEETKNRRHYDDQFKRDAVRLLTEGGQKISQVSRDLGVGVSVLGRWRRRFAGPKSTQTPTRNDNSAPVDSAEMEKLRKELAQVKEEREILKKALAVFSRRPV
jgi:transposase